MRAASAVAVVVAIAALVVASAALIFARGADKPRELAARLDAIEARTDTLAAQVKEASAAPQLDADALLQQLLSSEQLRDYVVRAGRPTPIAAPGEVPENVRRAAADTIKGLEIVDIRQRTARDGSIYYNVEGMLDGEKHDLRISESGEVLRADLPVAQAPEEVRKAAEAAVPGLSFASVERELRKDGGVLFEFKDGRVENDAGKYDTKVISADGRARVWEAEMPPALLPESVREAALKAVPGIELTQGEFVSEDQVFYRVEGRVAGRKCEITVSEAGEVINLKGKGLPPSRQDAPGETLF